MLITPAMNETMNPADWQLYQLLAEDAHQAEYFAPEIIKFGHCDIKPDDVLRRFSLNGDGKLDLREFQLAMKRLGICQEEKDIGNGHGACSGTANGNGKARELFHAFCPTSNRKLDVEMFCRIMNHWALLVMKQHKPPASSSTTQQGATTRPVAGNSMERTSSGGLSAANTNDGGMLNDPTVSKTERFAPYATNTRDAVLNNDVDFLLRHIHDQLLENTDKLAQIFFKMDINCSGTVTRQEFELALSHVGVLLTTREYNKLYESLPDHVLVASSASDSNGNESQEKEIQYSAFLSSLVGSHSGAKSRFQNHRIWDMILAVLDRLEQTFLPFLRIRQHFLSPESFRECLLKTGINLSAADFASLRVRLLPYCDSDGSVCIDSLLEALRSYRKNSDTSLQCGNRCVAVSPLRTGRKTVFSRPDPPTAPRPAGKSNEQRNIEANRTLVKLYNNDERVTKSELLGAAATINSKSRSRKNHESLDKEMLSTYENGEDNENKPCLELRIVAKLQQLKEIGKFTSVKTIFPGDRFGRITRGQFRQSLVHLGVLSRFAEVEKVFWTLDPHGKGFIMTTELYEYLNGFEATLASLPPSVLKSNLPPLNTSVSFVDDNTKLKPSRAVQKCFEAMLGKVDELIDICKSFDDGSNINGPTTNSANSSNSNSTNGNVSPSTPSGFIARNDFIWCVQELGILASYSDLQQAALCLSGRPDGRVEYTRLLQRLAGFCSDLLSPKKRHHLSMASVVLQQEHEPGVKIPIDLTGYSPAIEQRALSSESLHNCPRKRNHHDHRAVKTSIHFSHDLIGEDQPMADGFTGNNVNSSQQLLQPNVKDSEERRQQIRANDILRRQRLYKLQTVSIINDLLERRADLKIAFDLHRQADLHGQVTRSQLEEILCSSRLNLNFSTLHVKEFVDLIIPQEIQSIGFLEMIHRMNQTLRELASFKSSFQMGVSTNDRRTKHVNSNTPLYYHFPATFSAKKLAGTNFAPSLFGGTIAPKPNDTISDKSGSSGGNSNGWVAPRPVTSLMNCSDQASLRRKLLYESHLRDLHTENGRRSAAVLIRHAYKGVSRETTIPIESGQFEAICRCNDLKYVTYRLGLDLDLEELGFIVDNVDVKQTGFISSAQLLDFFVRVVASDSQNDTNHFQQQQQQQQGQQQQQQSYQPQDQQFDTSSTQLSTKAADTEYGFNGGNFATNSFNTPEMNYGSYSPSDIHQTVDQAAVRGLQHQLQQLKVT